MTKVKVQSSWLSAPPPSSSSSAPGPSWAPPSPNSSASGPSWPPPAPSRHFLLLPLLQLQSDGHSYPYDRGLVELALAIHYYVNFTGGYSDRFIYLSLEATVETP